MKFKRASGEFKLAPVEATKKRGFTSPASDLERDCGRMD